MLLWAVPVARRFAVKAMSLLLGYHSAPLDRCLRLQVSVLRTAGVVIRLAVFFQQARNVS